MRSKLLITCAVAAAALIGCYYGSQKSDNESVDQPQIIHKSHIKQSGHHKNYFNKFELNLNKKSYSEATISSKPFSYLNGKRKLVLGKLDNLGRATGSHIQLKESETPKVKRSAYLTVRPSGWHNYKFKVAGTGKTQWLYNRGHLVGYQFCGLNNEKRNLVTETTYLNQGSLNGMDQSNDKAMLFYENRLRKWMIMHPTCSLDYSVIPIYRDNELVPRSVKLTFVGYSKRGTKMRIKMPTGRVKVKGKISTVYLQNNSPQAKIDYATGRAQVN